MSAIKNGVYTVTLKGKEYGILFSLNALDEVQGRFGGYDKLEDAAKARAVGEEMYDQFLEWYHASREPAIK